MLATLAVLLSIFSLAQCVIVKFDDQPNSFPISNPYESLDWTNFYVSSPDRGTTSYVKYASPFQYGRILNGTTGGIQHTTGGFLINTLRYACSVSNADTNNPGPPQACQIRITENCAVFSHSRNIAIQYTPGSPIAIMGTHNFASGRTCRKALSYQIYTTGAKDILLDNIAIKLVPPPS